MLGAKTWAHARAKVSYLDGAQLTPVNEKPTARDGWRNVLPRVLTVGSVLYNKILVPPIPLRLSGSQTSPKGSRDQYVGVAEHHQQSLAFLQAFQTTKKRLNHQCLSRRVISVYPILFNFILLSAHPKLLDPLWNIGKVKTKEHKKRRIRVCYKLQSYRNWECRKMSHLTFKWCANI